jgi:hypothetical protein
MMKVITRNYRLFVGLASILIGIIGLIYSSYPLGTQKFFYDFPCSSCSPTGVEEMIQIEIPNRLRLSESGVIRVFYGFDTPSREIDSFGQPSGDRVISITLQTASFDTAPPSGQSIEKHLRNRAPQEWIWVIQPQREGRQIIIMQFSGIPRSILAGVASQLAIDQLSSNSSIMKPTSSPGEEVLEQTDDLYQLHNLAIPITVVDVLGLTAIQAKVINTVVTFLGSGFTLVWLYEQWQRRRSEGNAKQQTGRRKQPK